MNEFGEESIGHETDISAQDWSACRQHLQRTHDAWASICGRVNLYLLIDTRGYQQLDQQLATMHGLRYASLWRETGLQDYPDVAPYLIAFEPESFAESDGSQHQLLRQIWQEAVPLHAVTWIWSPYAFDEIEAHIRRYVIYALPGGRAYYLFFFDNHVLPRLRKVWTTEQSQRFVAPCFQMSYRDRRADEVVWRNDESAYVSHDSYALRLSDAQHSHLLDLGYPDKLALKFRESMGSSLSHLSDVDLHHLVVGQMERARRYGIEEEDALSHYVATGILIASDFDEHPLVQSNLERAGRGDMTIDEALAAVDDETWAAIRARHQFAL